jgi:hypothetical protein
MMVAYLPMFLGKIIFIRDVAAWNLPARWFLREALLRGDSPFWNPHQGIGLSVASSPLYGVFYPPNWLFLLVPNHLLASMLTWQSFAHLVWGGFGMVLLARRMGANGTGSGVAGLAWSLSGFNTATWITGLLLHAGSWFPWIAIGFICLARRLRQGGRGWLWGVVQAAVPVAMLLALGELYLAIAGLGFAFATAGAWLLLAEKGDGTALRHSKWIWLVALALASGLGVGLGSVTWLPALAGIHNTAREAVRFGGVSASLNPYRIMEFVAPNCMGEVSADYPASPWVGDPLLLGFPLIFSVYLGASVVALAQASLGRRRLVATALLGLAVLATTLAMGRFTPVHRIVTTLIPPLANMRSPEKFFVMTVGWVSLLAGLGATRMIESAPRPWRRNVVLGGLLLLLAALAGVLLPSARWAEHMRSGAFAGLAAVAGVLVACYFAPRRPRLASLAILLGVAVDLVVAGLPLREFVPGRLATAVPYAAQVILNDYKDSSTSPRLHVSAAAEAMAARSMRDDNMASIQAQSSRILSANLSIVHGVAALPGYDAATPRTLNQLSAAARDFGVKAMRLVGANYVVLPVEDADKGKPAPLGLVPMLEIVPQVRLYRVQSPLPRVFLSGRAELTEQARLPVRLLSDEVLDGRVALLEPESGARGLDGAMSSPGVCQMESLHNGDVWASCHADREAVAVFVEQFYPGWTAQVDGRPAPLWRANLLMRAVPLPAGDHRIHLHYQAEGVRAGQLGSLLSLLALVGLAIGARSRSHSDAGRST